MEFSCLLHKSSGKKFSISFKDKSVAQILDFISTKGDYKINYTDDVKNDTLLLTISFEDVDELSAVETCWLTHLLSIILTVR